MIINIHLIVIEDNLYKADYEMILSIFFSFKNGRDVIFKLRNSHYEPTAA